MFLHAFVLRPEAGEETRGYLHGGLFIDFIGQAPVSISRLLSFDFFILLIDVVMLALIIERVKLTQSSCPAPTGSGANTNTDTDQETAASHPQDHDAEERGVSRQEDGNEALSSTHDTAASSPNSSVEDEVEEERTNLLADPTDVESPILARGSHPMDLFAVGEAILVNMGFFSTLRDQWRHSTNPVQPRAGFMPTPETAALLRQRFGLQVGTDGRIVRANT